MANSVGTGRSVASNTSIGTREAVDQAIANLGGTPNLAMVFVGSNHDLAQALSEARAAMPSAEVLGCTTAGEFTEEGLSRGGIAVMVAALDDDITVHSAGVEDAKAAAKELTSGFQDASHRAVAQGKREATTVLLVDGLSGTGEDLVKAIRDETASYQQVVGGAAGDDGKFEGTHVGLNSDSGLGKAAAFHVFGNTPWGVGVQHGLNAATEQMVVTKSEANVVIEIDDKPAMDAYKEFAAAKGVTLNDDNRGSFMIEHEIGVHFFDEIARARAPLGVDENGAITCAATVPEGSVVSILDGNRDNLVTAARQAAEEAHKNLKGQPAAGVIVFDCVCRGMILDEDFDREIEAIREVFPGAPVAGFLTYGEIARYRGKLDGWHNTTAVVVAIPQ